VEHPHLTPQHLHRRLRTLRRGDRAEQFVPIPSCSAMDHVRQKTKKSAASPAATPSCLSGRSETRMCGIITATMPF